MRNELEFLNATHFKIRTDDGDYIDEAHLAAFDELVKFRATEEIGVFELTMPLKLHLTSHYDADENYKFYGSSWVYRGHHQSKFVSFLKMHHEHTV